MAQKTTRAAKVVGHALEYLGGIEATHILSTTALEVLSYSRPIEDQIRQVMDHQIDWTAPDSVHRMRPEEINGLMVGAQSEVADGFQRLNAQALIALWGGLEVLVEDLFVAWLADHPECLSHEIFQKLKLTLAEFISLDDDGRRRSLYQLYVASHFGARALGATRFESTLQPLSLSGELDADVSRALYELHIIRNLLVHQAGRVDSKFRQSDMGSQYVVGQRLYVCERQFRNYMAAVFAYATTLGERVKARQESGAR